MSAETRSRLDIGLSLGGAGLSLGGAPARLKGRPPQPRAAALGRAPAEIGLQTDRPLGAAVLRHTESGMENRPFARTPGNVLHVPPAWICKVCSQASHAAYATHWLISSRSSSG